jgi:hypothetical protein
MRSQDVGVTKTNRVAAAPTAATLSHATRPPGHDLDHRTNEDISRLAGALGGLLSRADVVPWKAAMDLAKGRAWPDTEEVTGSNPAAPTIPSLSRGFAGYFVPLIDGSVGKIRSSGRESA